MTKKTNWTCEHPILDSLPSLKPESIPSLVERVQLGDQVARQELLYQLLAYVKLRLPNYLRRMRNLRNDVDGLIGYVILWLLNAIDTKADARLLHYVAKSIRGECLKYQYSMNVYGPLEQPKVWKFQQRAPTIPELPIEHPVEFLSLDDQDELRGKAKTEHEYLFMIYRLQGYTNKEIAVKLGIAEVAVTRLRKVLAPRFGL